jgi:hypothetical protein
MKRIIFIILILSATLVSMAAQSSDYQNSVLALYKSSEGQTEKENEIFFYMSRTLEELRFKVVYWDIDQCIPGESVTRFHHAIISWFRGPSMRNPVAYLDFLDRMIDQGKKILVIDNMGAYQNSITNEYMLPIRLNLTLTKLGIKFLGDWTQDVSLLTLDHVNSDMVEYQAKQNTKESAFFYRFVATDSDMKTWLSIRRTDKDYESSPIIVSNSNGGFALSRYIYQVENGKVKLLINIPEYLKEALFFSESKQTIALYLAGNLVDIQPPVAEGESLEISEMIVNVISAGVEQAGAIPREGGLQLETWFRRDGSFYQVKMTLGSGNGAYTVQKRYSVGDLPALWAGLMTQVKQVTGEGVIKIPGP